MDTVNSNDSDFFPTRVIVLSELSTRDKEKYYNILIQNNCKFHKDAEGRYVANVRLLAPNVKKVDSNQRKEGNTYQTLPYEDRIKRLQEQGFVSVRIVGVDQFDYNTFIRFAALIAGNGDTVRPKARSLSWVMKMIEDIYDARFAHEKTDVEREDETAANPELIGIFPIFVIRRLSTVVGLKSLVDQTGWDLLYSIHHFRNDYLEIEIFARFLQEFYQLDDLLFFLYVRAVIAKALHVSFKVRWAKSEGPGRQPKALWMSNRECVQVARTIFGENNETMYRDFLNIITPQMVGQKTDALDSRRIDITQFLHLAVVGYHQTQTAQHVPQGNVGMPPFVGSSEVAPGVPTVAPSSGVYMSKYSPPPASGLNPGGGTRQLRGGDRGGAGNDYNGRRFGSPTQPGAYHLPGAGEEDLDDNYDDEVEYEEPDQDHHYQQGLSGRRQSGGSAAGRGGGAVGQRGAGGRGRGNGNGKNNDNAMFDADEEERVFAQAYQQSLQDPSATGTGGRAANKGRGKGAGVVAGVDLDLIQQSQNIDANNVDEYGASLDAYLTALTKEKKGASGQRGGKSRATDLASLASGALDHNSHNDYEDGANDGDDSDDGDQQQGGRRGLSLQSAEPGHGGPPSVTRLTPVSLSMAHNSQPRAAGTGKSSAWLDETGQWQDEDQSTHGTHTNNSGGANTGNNSQAGDDDKHASDDDDDDDDDNDDDHHDDDDDNEHQYVEHGGVSHTYNHSSDSGYDEIRAAGAGDGEGGSGDYSESAGQSPDNHSGNNNNDQYQHPDDSQRHGEEAEGQRGGDEEVQEGDEEEEDEYILLQMGREREFLSFLCQPFSDFPEDMSEQMVGVLSTLLREQVNAALEGADVSDLDSFDDILLGILQSEELRVSMEQARDDLVDQAVNLLNSQNE